MPPRWLKPLILALTALLIAACFTTEVSDSDTFWHLATGRYILTNHHLPLPDPFSWATYLGKLAYAGEERTKASAEAASFLKRLDQYREVSRKNPEYLNVMWRDEMTVLFKRMKDAGRIDLLDHHLSGGELNITQFPLQPRKK